MSDDSSNYKFPLKVLGREPGRPNKDLIKRLEDLLEEARSGKLQGLAYAWVREDGTCGDNWCYSRRHFDSRLMVFALECLKLQILKNWEITPVEEDPPA